MSTYHGQGETCAHGLEKFERYLQEKVKLIKSQSHMTTALNEVK